jgi:hypothetical protein
MLVMGIAVIGFMTMSVQAGTIDLIVNAYATMDPLTPGDASDDVVTPILTKCEDIGVAPTTPVNPYYGPGLLGNTVVTYEIAVAVDDTGASTVPGNKGLATIVFDVMNCGACAGYQMPYITGAETGYAQLGATGIGGLFDVTAPMYVDSQTTAYAGYNGGWGFDNATLPIGGNATTSLCDILGAGTLAPLTWAADVNSTYPGLQPYARLGVGIGTYTFPLDDPSNAAGKVGGFGQDLSNASNVIPGDGHWLMFRGTVDVSGWIEQADYGWDVVPTNGAVFSPTVDYNVDQGGGFRVAVSAADMGSDSFAFFLVPEPASLGLLLIGGLALIRRRP